MCESYLFDCVVSMRIYKYSNSVHIKTGLWVENDFLPQVEIYNREETVYLSLQEWKTIYQELEVLAHYMLDCNNGNSCNLYLYKLIYCDKRCSLEFANLVLEAINTFGDCINLRLEELRSEYKTAMGIVNEILNCSLFNNLSSCQNLATVLRNFVDPYSLIELEVINIGSAYFLKCLGL